MSTNQPHDHSTGAPCSACARSEERVVPDREGRLPIDNAIGGFICCGLCQKERPKNIAMRHYARLNVGFTEEGLQIWCTRHDVNVLHLQLGEGPLVGSGRAHQPAALAPAAFARPTGPLTHQQMLECADYLDRTAEEADLDDGALGHHHHIADRLFRELTRVALGVAKTLRDAPELDDIRKRVAPPADHTTFQMWVPTVENQLMAEADRRRLLEILDLVVQSVPTAIAPARSS
jgi:hypothetical protein